MRNPAGDALLHDRAGQKGVCESCFYRFNDEDSGTEHCFRFARFVDHVINEASKDCEYWQASEVIGRQLILK